MDRHVLAVGFVLTLCSVAMAIPQRTVGAPICTKDRIADTLTTRFVTLLNGDNIQHVYGCRPVPGTVDQFTTSTCTFTIEQNGGNTYLIVESVIDLNNPGDTTGSNPCGFVRTDVDGKRGFTWLLALRRWTFGFLTHIDRDYTWRCEEQLSLNTFVSTSFNTLFDNLVVTPMVNNMTLTLSVLKRDPSSNSGFSAATSCQVGEDLVLQLRMLMPTPFQSGLTPWGLYAYNTVVAPTDEMLGSSTANPLTGPNGCQTVGNLLDLQSGFTRRTESNSIAAVYWSGVLQCYRYLNTNNLWFATYVGLCDGTFQGDARCDNFCQFSTTSGRRKRQADENDPPTVTKMVATITVINQHAQPGQHSSEEYLGMSTIVIVVVMVGVVVALVLVAFVAFFVFSSRRRRRDNGVVNDSRATSEKSLPVKM